MRASSSWSAATTTSAEDDVDRLADLTLEFVTGPKPNDDYDRVLATVLFTDIVASTERAIALGDRRWRDVLDDHDRIVRATVEQFRGRLIKTTGDGALATFDGPARAVRAGQAIVEGVQRLGVEAHVGVHAGEVELRDDDIGGIGVHIGARVAALAGAVSGSRIADGRRPRRRFAARVLRRGCPRAQERAGILAAVLRRRSLSDVLGVDVD